MATQFESILSDAREAKDLKTWLNQGCQWQLNTMMQNIQQAAQAAGQAGGPAAGSAEPVNAPSGDDDIIDITPEWF